MKLCSRLATMKSLEPDERSQGPGILEKKDRHWLMDAERIATENMLSDCNRTLPGQARITQELERANEALQSFASTIAHDLKAPLRGIATLADWLATDQQERMDDEGRKHLQLLIRRVHRLDAFIDGLLEWTRTGHIQEASIPVDLNTLVRETIEGLMPPPHISLSVASQLPALRIQWPRIQQVFQNLLDNAIRFMDKPRGRIEISCAAEEQVWKFSVSDNGPGIDPRHFQKIFQLFQTLHPRDRLETSGVGLAIVKKIIEGYGGRIWVESTPGQGSTFFFTLPRFPAGAPIPIRGRKDETKPILLIEDDLFDYFKDE